MVEYNGTVWVCKKCGQKIVNSRLPGRPQPGQCPAKGKDNTGKPRPHSWTIDRK